MERLTVTIDGNSTGLDKALKSAENRLNSFNTRVTNSSRSLTGLMKSLSGLTGQSTAYAASVAAMTAANQRAAASLTALANRTNRAAAGNTRLAASSRAVARGHSTMNIGVKDLIMGFTSLNTLIYTTSFIFGGVIKSTIEANSQFEKMTVLLKNVSNESNGAFKAIDGKNSLAYIYDLADKVPFKIEALSKAFVKFKSNGIDPTQGSLRGLTDAISFFGGGSEELERASTAISQMLSKGTVQMEDLKGQLAETGGVPTAIKLMAEAAGYAETNMKGFYKAMKDGAVDSSVVIPKFLALLQTKYKGAGENMMNTWDGLVSRMSNAWSKMLVRITTFGGSTGFFNVLKKNMADLIAFMSNKDSSGEEFGVKLSRGLGTAIQAVADAIKFLYKYRDTIIEVGSALVKMWAISKGIAMVKSLGFAIGGLYGNFRTFMAFIPASITFLTRLWGIKNGLQLVTLLFGVNTAKAAKAMGLFTAANQISRGAMLSLIAPYTTVAGLIALIGANYYGQYKKLQESSGATAAHTKAMKDNETALDNDRIAIANLNDAQGDQIKAANAVINNLKAQAREQIRTTTVTLEAAKKRMQAAQIEAQSAGKGGGIGASLPSAAGSVLDSFGPVGTAAKLGISAVSGYAFGIDPFTPGSVSGRAALLRKNAAERDAREAEERRQAAIARLAGLEEGQWGKVSAGLMGGNRFTAQDPAEPKEDKKANAAAEAAARKLEAQHQKWIELKIKSDELKYEAEKGTTEGFETDDAREQAEEAVKVYKTIEDTKVAIDHLKDANRDATTDIKRSNVLKELGSDLAEQKKKTDDAFENYSRGFESIGSKVKDYQEGLNDKYGKDLQTSDPKGMAYRIELTKQIAAATENYRKELITTAAVEYKSKNKEITDSLLTERQLRQNNYNLEVAQVNDLLSKITGKSQAELQMASDLNGYLGNLAAQKKFTDAGPLAGWARDAADLKENLNGSLTGMMDGFVDTLADGKANFADFATSIVKDLVKIIVKAYLAKAILDALGLGTGAIGGTGASIAGTAPGSIQTSTNLIKLPNFSKMHTGGTVGGSRSGLSANVDPAMFSFAERYHTGGFPGLKPNEVPIIAEKGEGVFTKDQMRAMGSGSGKGAAAPTINIINQTSSPVTQESSQPRFDGEKYVIDVLLKNANKPGPVRDMMMGNK